MASLSIVEHFDVLEQIGSGFVRVAIADADDPLSLENPEEAFHNSVEAPIFVKLPFERFWVGRAGYKFRERCSVLGSE